MCTCQLDLHQTKKNGWGMKDLEAEVSEIPIFLLIL